MHTCPIPITQRVQSDTNTSSLSAKLEILITTNTTYRGIIVIINGKKGVKGYDTGINGGGIIGKYNDNNKENP